MPEVLPPSWTTKTDEERLITRKRKQVGTTEVEISAQSEPHTAARSIFMCWTQLSRVQTSQKSEDLLSEKLEPQTDANAALGSLTSSGKTQEVFWHVFYIIIDLVWSGSDRSRWGTAAVIAPAVRGPSGTDIQEGRKLVPTSWWTAARTRTCSTETTQRYHTAFTSSDFFKLKSLMVHRMKKQMKCY